MDPMAADDHHHLDLDVGLETDVTDPVYIGNGDEELLEQIAAEIPGDPTIRVKIDSGKVHKSNAWQYFGHLYRRMDCIDKKNLYCSLCLQNKQVKRYGPRTATSSMNDHLEQKHSIVWKKQNADVTQKKMQQFFSAKEQNPKSLSRLTEQNKKFVLARDLALWFSRDLLPFNLVEKQGFQDFCKKYGVVTDGQGIPDPRTISRTALSDVYNHVYQRVRDSVSALKIPSSATFDCWTDNHKRLSYITYTLHWINSNWEVKGVTLKTAIFPHPHTGMLIARDFEFVLEIFNLEKDKMIVVTDSGANVVCATNIMKVKRLACIAHNLHNLITSDLMKNEAMNEVSIIITKMREIHRILIYKQSELKEAVDRQRNEKLMEFIEEQSSIASILEAEEHTSQGDGEGVTEQLPDHSYGVNPMSLLTTGMRFRPLRRDVAVRWNSSLTMMKSFLRNKDAVRSLLEQLQRYDKIITDDEYGIIQELVELLEVFQVTTEILCGSKYPTMSLELLFRTSLYNRLSSLARDNDGLIKTATNIILENFDRRFPLNDENVCAAIMDPCSQNMDIVKTYLQSKNETKTTFLQRMALQYSFLNETNDQVNEQEHAPLTPEPCSSTSIKQQNMPKWKKIRLEMLREHCETFSSHSFQSEVEKYNTVIPCMEDTALEWWQKNHHGYPKLSYLARIYLAVPATSAASERVFSIAGSLLTAKRSQLDPERVQKILFIHDNYEFLKDM